MDESVGQQQSENDTRQKLSFKTISRFYLVCTTEKIEQKKERRQRERRSFRDLRENKRSIICIIGISGDKKKSGVTERANK